MERDGEIYLLDRGHHEVRVFGVDGSFRRSFGQEGDGPGEFRSPNYIEFLGDTVVVAGRRLNLLDTEGTPLATGRGPAASERGFLLRSYSTAIGWIGSWMSRVDETVPRGQPFRESVSLQLVDRGTADRLSDIFSYQRPEQRVSRGEYRFAG